MLRNVTICIHRPQATYSFLEELKLLLPMASSCQQALGLVRWNNTKEGCESLLINHYHAELYIGFLT